MPRNHDSSPPPTRLEAFLIANRIWPGLLLKAVEELPTGRRYSSAYLFVIRKKNRQVNQKTMALIRAACSAILKREVGIEELFDFELQKSESPGSSTESSAGAAA